MENKFYSNLTDTEKLLIEPVLYYYDIKGKNIRKNIINLLGLQFGLSHDIINDVDEIISLIHNASLVIDDIQDNSDLRRNMPSAHIKYGLPLALNAGYLAIFKTLTEVNKRSDLKEETKHKIIENLYNAHIGQGMDIFYTKTKIIPTLEEYNLMIHYKTGLLFITILELLMEKTNNFVLKKKYNLLLLAISKFSLFFQIRDDYINLTDIEYWKTRGFCQDFDEQKISYLITFCNNNKLDNYDKINILLLDANTIETKIEILKLMENNKLFDLIYNQLFQLKQEILELLNLESIFEILPFEKFNMENVDSFINLSYK